MTQKQKAQAYDEALGWMREMYPCLTDSLREDAEHYFPELRENEDENLENKSGYYKAGKFWKASTLWNATKNKIPQRVSNRYILQECTWNIGTLQRFADEVKNVQEVSLDYPIILDMNGNILDGAHRVVKAYLEGKDIDIVYLGDDEWPEPDYDEEKAVKESEDEQTRKWIWKLLHRLHYNEEDHSMALKAIEWLEKQKESLPISETCKENANSFTDGIIEVRSFQRGMEEGRKLEKQKEQNQVESEGPHYTKRNALFDKCVENCDPDVMKKVSNEVDEMLQKEQNDEDGFLEDELSAFLQNYDKEYDDDAAVSDVARHFYEIGKKQKEQKPVECIEFDNEFEKQVSHLLASVLNGEWEYNEGFVKHAAQSLLGYAKNEMKQKLPLMGGDTDTYFDDLRITTKPLTSREWFDEGIKYAQRLQKEQKHNYCLYGGYPNVRRCRWCSAACSARLADVHTDEEKEYIRTIKSIISDFIRDKKPENLAYYQRIYDWLDGRHVPFSCGHENDKPAEWSGEDEDMLNSCISSIEEAKENRYAYKETDGDTSYDHEIAWLKSLRPSWKPSEEQMEALKRASVNEYIPAKQFDILVSLYKQLKKLM